MDGSTRQTQQLDATAVRSVPLASSEPIPSHFGRYRVVERLGSGAFGSVFKAFDEELLRLVAVKVPNANRVLTPQEFDEFKFEARIVAGLRHQNIVPVFDFGCVPEGPCFIVYEYISGFDLAARLSSGRLPWQETAVIVSTVAEALAHAHKHGIVHRDVKPSNILLNEQGRALVADFGLAVNDLNRRLKRGELAGTPSYMSPEQVRGESHRLDGRTDIWSLGVVLYEMLTGRKPFQGHPVSELFEEIESLEPQPPRMLDDAISEELEQICLRALSKQAKDRYSTAKDMAGELRETLETRDISSRTIREFAGDVRRTMDQEGVTEVALDDRTVKRESTPAVKSAPKIERIAQRIVTTGDLIRDLEVKVFRPRSIVPQIWYQMVAFVSGAHTSPSEAPNEITASRLLVEAEMADRSRSNETAVVRSGMLPAPEEVTLVPSMVGCDFDPLRRTIPLDSTVQAQLFRVRTHVRELPRLLTGTMSVFAGGVLVGRVPLALRATSVDLPAEQAELSVDSLQKYRRVFVAFNPADPMLHDHVEFLSQRLQIPSISYRTKLSVSDRESPEIQRAIEESDVFQLLWTRQSANSSAVSMDYAHALSLRRQDFVRPIYWTDVSAVDQESLTPPAALSKMRFEDIGRAAEPDVSAFEVVVLSLQTGYQIRIRVPRDRITRFGREPYEGWAIPWEPKMSREHGYFWLDGGTLSVRCRDSLNPLSFRGQSVREITMFEGTDFRIGDTLFVFCKQNVLPTKTGQLNRTTLGDL